MKRGMYALPAVVLLLFFATGRAQIKPLSAAIEPNSGSVSGNVYKNDYFAFSYEFPAGWTLIDLDLLRRADRQKMREREREGRAKMGLPPGAQVRVAGDYTLAVASKYPEKQTPPGQANPEINIWTQEMGPDTAGKLFEFQATKGEFVREPGPDTLGGRNVVRGDVHLEDGDHWIYVSRMVQLEGDYVLAIDVKARTKQELDELVGSAKHSLAFTNRPESGGVGVENRYVNHYFGLSYTFPSGWTIASREMLNLLIQDREEDYKKQLFGDKPIPPNVHIESTPIFELLLVTKLPIGKEGKANNSTVEIWAEQDPLVSTTEQYFPNRKFLKDPLAEVSLAATKVSYGGREFLRADRHVKAKKGWFESRIVRVEQGYVLVMEIHAETKEELDQIAHTAESIAFEGGGKP